MEAGRGDALQGMDFVSLREINLMNRGYIAAFFSVFLFFQARAQERLTRNIIVVTLDGLRWHEVFRGADPSILKIDRYVGLPASIASFRGSSAAERRRSLLPFFWEVISAQGQLYGNRSLENKVNCTNHHLLSYPGYSEMLVGFRNARVSSNRKVENPHATVLESIGRREGFRNRVAAFTTWDAFPYILRESRSKIHVNSGTDPAEGDISGREERLNEIQEEAGRRSDSLTFHYALEYMKRERPRVTFIGFDETDQHAHAGRYDEYLKAAHRADVMIADLWRWLQAQPDYRDRTTLLITTDHGRGNGRNNWRKHRLLARGSRHIWFAVLGPDTPAFGEMKIKNTTYQDQVAKTIAAFLGLPYENSAPVGDPVQTMMAIPDHSAPEVLSVR